MENKDKIKLTIHPAEFGAKMPIPLAEQSVKAGFPSPAQDYMEGEIDLNDILIRHREATFYVRISGDSMKDAGIFDGDLAVVDRQIEPSNGNFVIAFVDGEFTIKQFKMDESGTCVGANIPGYEVCGKTGTAQNRGADHSAFMGFAPMDKPRIAVAVYVENGGSGPISFNCSAKERSSFSFQPVSL